MLELFGSFFDILIWITVGCYLFIGFRNKKSSILYKKKWAIFGSVILIIFAIFRSYMAIENYTNNNIHELQDIVTIYENGDMNESIVRLNSYVKNNNENKIAWNLLGNAYASISNDSLAKYSYFKAISVDSTYPNPYTGLGIIMRRNGDLNNASKYYYKAIKVDSNYAQAFSSLAVIELLRHNDSLAVKWAEKASSLEPENINILANTVLAYHFNNQKMKRDSSLSILEKKGYTSLDEMKKIISGEQSIR